MKKFYDKAERETQQAAEDKFFEAVDKARAEIAVAYQQFNYYPAKRITIKIEPIPGGMLGMEIKKNYPDDF